ncbi:MAG: acyl-ACP--UDP-N-acetylglucosamine O-acyltransferase, partial [Litorimonas sp.]
KIGAGVKIGPYCIVGANVELGDNVELVNHVSLNGHTKIGAYSKLYPFVSMGYPPQDFKHKGGQVSIEIGERCVFRENVNIHPGTDIGNPVTRIGHDCYFMVGTHLAHEGQMGNHVVVSNGAQIGGGVVIGDYVVLGGLCAVHQYTRIGAHAFIGGMATVTTDVIPYGFVTGNPSRLAGLNIVGLKRRDFSRQTIHDMRGAYRLLFAQEGTFSERLADTESNYKKNEYVTKIVDFIKAQENRSICMPNSRR